MLLVSLSALSDSGGNRIVEYFDILAVMHLLTYKRVQFEIPVNLFIGDIRLELPAAEATESPAVILFPKDQKKDLDQNGNEQHKEEVFRLPHRIRIIDEERTDRFAEQIPYDSHRHESEEQNHIGPHQ